MCGLSATFGHHNHTAVIELLEARADHGIAKMAAWLLLPIPVAEAPKEMHADVPSKKQIGRQRTDYSYMSAKTFLVYFDMLRDRR